MANDIDYLGKLQDYYADHKILPSYAVIAQLLGFKSKNAVTALVARLKLLSFIESAPDGRLKPGRRFFDRVLAESTVQAGFATAALSDRNEALSIDDYLIERPSDTVLITGILIILPETFMLKVSDLSVVEILTYLSMCSLTWTFVMEFMPPKKSFILF